VHEQRTGLGKPLKLPYDLLYRSGRIDFHGRSGSQEWLDNAKVHPGTDQSSEPGLE
jgi:hypothetical protein